MPENPASNGIHPGPAREPPRFQRLWRRQGEPARRSRYRSAAELPGWSDDHDLDLLVAPIDGTHLNPETEYEAIVEQYGIPDEFVWERDTSVTHSFGRWKNEDGREVLWMHFLAGLPHMDGPNRQPEWLKWGFFLTWAPKKTQIPPAVSPSGTEEASTNETYTVGLIVFRPPLDALQLLVRFLQSPSWSNATLDPFVLVDTALLSWYHRMDRISWSVTNLIREEEKDIFHRAQTLTSATESSMDLHRMHTSAKTAIFMIESLDAAIRTVDSALADHERHGNRGDRLWENTHRMLRHRRELFHSTRLRIVSCQARIKNTVDLAFHINTARDSQVNLENSRSMRVISIVGLIFLPFTTVTSIFGTQFFSSGPEHMTVNPDFWILWVVAVPLTLFIMGMWQASERGVLKWPPVSVAARFSRYWSETQEWASRHGGKEIPEGTELGDIGAHAV